MDQDGWIMIDPLKKKSTLAFARNWGFNEFTKVSFDEMDLAAQSCALPGPFVEDKAWGLALQTKAVDGAGPSELQPLGRTSCYTLW